MSNTPANPFITGYSRPLKTVYGKAAPNTVIPVTNAGTVAGNAQSDQNGNWNYVFGTAPADNSLISVGSGASLSQITAPTAAAARSKITLTGSPSATTVSENGPFSFTPVKANGSGPVTYRYRGPARLPGISFDKTTGALSATSVGYGADGSMANYYITATDDTGVAELGPFSLSVTKNSPTLATMTLDNNSISSGAPAYTKIGNVLNVPPGIIPRLSPDDGRVILDGDSSRGWALYKGATANSGQVDGTIRATGANSLTISVTFSDGANAPVFKGNGQGMRLVEATTASASVRSSLSRTQHYCNVDIKRFRLVYPVFYIQTSTAGDTYLPNKLTFQSAIEPTFFEGVDNIPLNRQQVTFNDNNTAVNGNKLTDVFDPSITSRWDNTIGYIISDLITLPTAIPRRTKFGLWSCLEGDTTNVQIPYSWLGSNAGINRNTGYLTSASSLVASNSVMNATSIAAHSTTNFQGGTTYFTPAMMLVETSAGTECVCLIGDSIAKGVGNGIGAGVSYPASYGNVQGDLEGNMGIGDAGLYHDVKCLFVNFSKGSDGVKNAYAPGAARFRRQLRMLCNPSKHFDGYGHNDASQNGSLPAWAATTAYVPGDSLNINGVGIYTAQTAGTTGGTQPTWPTTAGATVVDGGVTWQRMTGSQGGNGQQVWRMLGYMSEHHRQLKADLPAVPIHQMTLTPYSDSAGTEPNKWTADPATDQTVVTSVAWAVRAPIWNAEVLAINPVLKFDKVWDIRPDLTYNFASAGDTMKWRNDPYRLTNDGVHLTNVGNDNARPSVVRSMAA